MENLESRIVLTGTPISLDVDSTGASNPSEFVQIGNTVFFAAEDIVSGRELWQTDGTIAGTTLVTDINPDIDGSSSPTELIELNGSLLFSADDGTSGEELWIFDGVTTLLLSDINTGAASSSPQDLTLVGSQIFFSAETADGRELWVTDGTQAGTVLISDINAGADSSSPENLVDVDGVLFFTATDATNGRELWMSDGTAAGTVLVQDIFVGPDSSSPQQLTAVGGDVFFVAETLDEGTELWRSDGTAGGTELVSDIGSGSVSGVLPTNDLIEFSGLVLFAADDGISGTELWISDGTEEGTELLLDIQPGANSGLENVEFTAVGAAVAFVADDGVAGDELWVTLGTPDSTNLISDINVGPDGSSPRGLVDINSELFFSADDGENGQELWESRGTPATTFIVADLAVGAAGSNPTELFNFDGILLFSADDGSGADLWAVDTAGESVAAPTNLDLVSAADSGVSGDDNITSFNNADPATALVFTVDGVVNGATVQVFSDDVLIGTGTAFGNTATINTDGTTVLADGLRTLRATQTVAGGESLSSSDLLVTIDTTAPAAIQGAIPTEAQPGQLFTFDADSPDEGTAGVVYALAAAPTGATIDPDTGVIEWTPTSDTASPVTFEILVSDEAGNSASQSASVSIAGAFSAVADAYDVNEDSTLTIDAANGVLANDGATGLTASLVNDVASGTLTLGSDGGFTYVPDPDFSGTDVFTYVANDGTDDSNVAAVTLTVAAENDSPTVVVDTYTVEEDSILTIDAAAGVLANDTDADGDSLTATLATQATNGVVVLNTDGSFTYTPDIDFVGADSFEYTVEDGTITSEPVTVSLTVTEVASSPVPAADSYDVSENTSLTVPAATGVLANDQDAVGTLTLAVVTQPTDGIVTLLNDGSFTYTPDTDFVGTDTFTYTINDGTTTSTAATVTLTVASTDTNTAPIAVDDTFTVTNDGTQQTFDVLSNDSDPDGATTLTITDVSTGSAGGTIAIDGGQINYTPAAGFSGVEAFTYTLEDADGLSDTASVTVTVESAAVVGGTVSGSVFIDHSNDGTQDGNELGVPGVLITLTGDDDNGNAITETVLTQDDGTYQFTDIPPGTYTVTETQPNAIADVVGATNEVTGVTVTEGEDTDVAAFAEANIRAFYHSLVWCFSRQRSPQTPEELFREIIAIGEEDAGNFDLANQIRNGAIDPPDVDVDPDPDPDPDEDVAPVAEDDSFTTTEGTELTVSAADGVLGNDTDANGDTLTAVIGTPATNGTLALSDDGSFVYNPNSGFTGSDSFTYTAFDGTNSSNTATVTITVEADIPNIAPVTAADTYTVDEDITLTVSAADGVLDNDSDVDGDTLTVSVVDTPPNGALTLNGDGSFEYTPNADFSGTDTFTYIANDGTVDSNISTVTITVDPLNDSPVATADNYSATEDTTLGVPAALGVLENDTDVDSPTLTASIVVPPSSGTLDLETDGSFNYVPEADFSGDVTFIYEVSDGDGATAQATGTISIGGVNDAPVAVNDSYQVDEDTTLAIDAVMGLLANDTDVENDVLLAQLVDVPTNGSIAFNDDGSFEYTPNANFAGTDSFVYEVSDGVAIANATVTIEVLGVEDPGSLVLPPELTDPSVVPSAVVGEAVSFDIDVDDPDADDIYVYQLDLEASGIPAGATMPVIDPSTGEITWTPSVAGGPFEIRVIVVDQDRFADQETFLVNILASDVDNSI